MSDYDVIKYLHVGDSIYWHDPASGQRQGPGTILGFSVTGIGADGRQGQSISITPVNGLNAVAPIMLLSRTSVYDGSVQRFNAGEPV